ncbi:hypothetical protein G7Z17_g1083 [Cylindrodendrum hubeiense]|uniref:Uncharacterized protein n=1 Tax=Cylindrodendrum hubeiense TaxID=595255 RepID=A0A9P5LFP0_9HYPO|nr:hypothetical protein G7Z17_g1083 [Cylindrodendrum hubeiense]
MLAPLSGQLVGKLDMTEIYDALTFRRLYIEPDSEMDAEDDDDDYNSKFVSRYSCEDEPVAPKGKAQAQMHYDKSTEHKLLRGLFDNLKKVDAFSLAFPRATSGDTHQHPYAESYDIQALDEIAATIQYGLSSTAFQHLVQLHLRLPCTRDVERFTNTMSSDARGRLRTLRISIVDETGQDGNDEIENVSDPGEEGVANGASLYDGIPPSNLQAEFPNREHQDGLWEFVASCSNLESLSIQATHFLDLDQLKWLKSPQSRGLRFLSLNRIWTSISSMIELLRPHPEYTASPQVRSIALYKVKVHTNGGNWSELFSYLKNDCPDLACCEAEQLTYFSEHPNFQWNNRIWENYNAIWTEQKEDWDELRDMARSLIRKAGGKEFYPQQCVELIFDDDDEE